MADFGYGICGTLLGRREQAIAGDLFAQADIVDLVYELATAAGEIIRGWPGVLSSKKAVPDAIITASALATTATLVTLDTRQFSRLRVPGLSLLLIDQQAPNWIPPST